MMRICPKNAKEFGHNLTEQQAREWCARVFDRGRCVGCDLGRRVRTSNSGEIEIEKADLAAGGVEQGRLF